MTEAKNSGASASSADSDEFSLDAILVRICQFGKFQLINYLLLCILALFNATSSVTYYFTASTVVHRCRVSECDGPDSVYKEPWTQFSIPMTSAGDLENCNRLVPYNRTFGEDVCYAENYDQTSKEKCGIDFIFRDEGELSISNSFDIFCSDEWKLSMVGTINNMGNFIGIPLGGFIADICRVPECDGPDSVYKEPWTKFSIPTTSGGDLENCNRLVHYNRTFEEDVCFPENYDQNSKEKCGIDFIFRDKEVSISNEFDIYCSDEWKLLMVGTISNLGYFIGIPLGGYFADICRVPECDGPDSVYKEPWTQFSIPMTSAGDLENCNRLVPYNRTFEEDVCYVENYDQNSKEKCGIDFIFRDEKEVTISNEFDIFCSDEWKLSMVGTINNVGNFIGIPLGGFFADRYGRRTMLAVGGFLSGIMGIIRSFSSNYYMFLAFEFLDNVCGGTLYATVFILGLELVGPRVRVVACSVITIFYALGEVLLAVVAKYFPHWRLILRIFYIPALAQIAFLWILPESVRWLLSQGEEEKATKVLQKAAKVNKRKLSDHSIDKLLLANRYKLAKADEGSFPIKEAFKSFFWRIVNCSLCWFTHVLVYYGLSLNAVSLGGNKYDNFVYISLVEIPGFLIPIFTMNRMGRRYSLFGYLLICGVCIAATIFVRSDLYGLQLTLFLLGKLAITASFQVLYFFTSEIFPTNVRNTLLSFCSMFGRFGSMVAPQTPLMAKYFESAPAILFSGCALISGFMSLLFPETTNVVLPTTMNEAGEIGQKKKAMKTETGNA